MPVSRNQVNSEFQHIAITATDGSLQGVAVDKLQVANIANFTLPGGTSGQVIGTDGTGNLSWVNGGGSVLGEYGSASPTDGQTFTNAGSGDTTWTDVSNCQFTILTSGTWEINYLLAFTNSTTNWVQCRIADPTGTAVPLSKETITPSGANTPMFITGTCTVTTTGPTVYRFQARTFNNSTVTISNNATAAAQNGQSYVRWQKISGFIPTTGTVGSYAKYRRGGEQTTGIGVGGIIICDVPEVASTNTNITPNLLTGQITLAPGNTYRLRAGVPGFVTSNATANLGAQWYNETLGIYVGEGFLATNPTASNQWGASSTTAEYTFTPSVTTVLSFRVTTNNNVTKLGGNTDFAQPQAGYPWVEVEQLGTSSVAQFVGTLSSVYSSSLSYPTGTIVVKDGMLYQSNAAIAAGTLFTIGTTGATWSQIGFGQVNAEYGESIMSATPISAAVNTTYDVVSFTLPTAGTWEIEYIGRYQASAAGGWGVLFITDNNNATVTNSEIICGGPVPPATGITGVPNTQIGGTGVIRVTTSGQAIYKLRIYAATSGGTLSSDNNGRTSVKWKKISGFVPSNGLASSYGSYQVTARSTIGDYTLTALQGNMPVISSTFVQLKANIAYEMRASLSVRSTYSTFGWYTAAGALLGQPGDSFSTNANDPGVTVPAYAVFTPTVDTQVKLTLISLNGYTQTDWGYGEVSIRQIGTTQSSGFIGSVTNGWDILNTYASGTIVVKDNIMYQANSTVPAGTPFTIGTTGATWTTLNTQVAENGSLTTIPSGQTTSSSALVDVTGSTFTLPTAGTWEITYELSFYNNTGGGTEIVLANATSNAIVPGSRTRQNASTNEIPTSKTVQVTITSSTAYKLRFSTAGAGTTLLNTANDIGAIYWTKISGFLPLTQSGEITGYANQDVLFDSTYGWGIYFASGEAQFYFKNTSAAPVNIVILDQYYIDTGNAKSQGQRGKTTVASNAVLPLWQDTTLLMNGAGDIETGYIIVSTSGSSGYNTATTVSKYEYYCSVGPLYANNYYRIKKVW